MLVPLTSQSTVSTASGMAEAASVVMLNSESVRLEVRQAMVRNVVVFGFKFSLFLIS